MLETLVMTVLIKSTNWDVTCLVLAKVCCAVAWSTHGRMLSSAV